jgi:hypothetical protein
MWRTLRFRCSAWWRSSCLYRRSDHSALTPECRVAGGWGVDSGSMGSDITLFSGYSQKENRTTNYCLLVLKMLYE